MAPFVGGAMDRARSLVRAALVAGALVAPAALVQTSAAFVQTSAALAQTSAAPAQAPSPPRPAAAPRAGIDWDRTLENTERIVTILGLLTGGAWAYFKFFRGRVFVPRLETDLAGRVSAADGALLLTASVRLKNVGLSRVDIHQRGTALRLSVLRGLAGLAQAAEAPWEKARAFEIFLRHRWIESGETIHEEILIALPAAGLRAFRLELRLVGSLHRTALDPSTDDARYTWRDVCIVQAPAPAQTGGTP
jgi:hypothetical protein